ncbi:ABC transporter substrate-binding protein [Actinoplanes derwentensis]|uniref:Peptide/nickel transport system substrate-binding protein n=2 Tax=Actinoplanes derwentensis TaxID=113562 RepID=A0A1H1URP6_9ACTN|nr:ABC transporter substrate-binding protein [Actinoplanes derwentensis]GID88141.1 ABC transporter substrate-binding protein [Actinoplanes derwentensis]SDS74921.1 peptide/nickel transport system substrate-binding protein [Actinoplanes derwentensis]
MNRRKLLTAAVVATALTALSACSGGATPGTSSSTGTGGTLKLAFLAGISTPDPDTAYDGPELNLVNSAYEGLLKYQPGQAKPQLTGALATKWAANADNTVFTFDLRTGVTFHDGTAFTASAVEPSFQRRTTMAKGPSYMVADVKSVEAPSDSQVVITLKAPNSAFLDLLASPFGPKMLSPKALQDHPTSTDEDNWFATHDAGTGPYTYGTFEPDADYKLTAYPGYWGTKPGYSAVDFTVLASMSTIQLKLQSGELDGVIGSLDGASFTTLKGDSSLTTSAFSSMQTPTLFVNPKSAAVGAADVRAELLAGIDFAALMKKALPDTTEPTTEVFPVNLLADPGTDQQKITYDATALAGLASGALAGKTVKIAYTQTGPDGQALSDNLAAVLNTAGIKAESVGYAAGTYYPALAKGADAPDLTIFAGFPDTAHPDAWASVFYTPDGGLDLFGAEVPGLAETLAAARKTNDQAAYGRAAAMVSESAYWYSMGTMKGTASFAKDVAGADTAWHPVITGVLELNLLHPAS